MSKRMSGDMSERMAKDMSERMSERMSKDMSEKLSEDMSERMSKDMSQRTRIHVCTNGILWMAFCFLFDVAHCSKYCWLNVFLCKEVSLVWQPWRRLWWHVLKRSSLGQASRFAKGVEHVWRYKLTFVGAERIYVCMEPPSATHVYPGRSRGMWAYEGRACSKCGGRARAREARCSSFFALRPRFGRMECTSGRQMMCGAGPPTQKR